MSKSSQQARNAAAAAKLKARIAAQLKRGANKGVEAATRFLAARIKETLSVPAPRKAVRGTPQPGKRLGPILAYRAASPAIPGAPPRKLSGRMRQSVTQQMLTPTIGVVGLKARSLPSKKYPQGFNYPRYHELGSSDAWGGGAHQFIKPTVEKYHKELQVIIGGEVRTELRIS